MKHVLTVLYAVLGSQVWSIDQVVSWADRLIEKSVPQWDWLAGLNMSKSTEEGLDLISEGMKKSGIQMSGDMGDLMVGFILMGFDKGDCPEKEARAQLIEVADAEGSSAMDAEFAGVIEFDAPPLLLMKAEAERYLKCLTNYNLAENRNKPNEWLG